MLANHKLCFVTYIQTIWNIKMEIKRKKDTYWDEFSEDYIARIRGLMLLLRTHGIAH